MTPRLRLRDTLLLAALLQALMLVLGASGGISLAMLVLLAASLIVTMILAAYVWRAGL